ncbi:STAS domain-containing protein [Duganella sp. BJB1802]|uniref:STAS domain-containing protein n=1 Tax=Duganella sp. BJB1802 TaxID=2744575 RepID=UPI001594CFB0|nr:STAS domain-containing protein [Duganella sp. BJB1802]
MGLFSIFKKTDATPAPAPSDDDEAARLAANSETERQQQQARQREIARATAMKIDAIESAMTFDIFNEPEPAWGSQRAARPARPRAAAHAGPDTQALDDLPTTLLLRDDDLPQQAVAAETAPVVEEIAILYANGQGAVAEQLLTASVAEAGGDRTVWWMLFDLYQVSGQRERFDNLSIDYASTFETSPPPWNAPAEPAASSSGWAGLTPTEAFAGVLDAHIDAQLERLRQAAAASPVLRLEFSRVTAVEPAGCALLLDTLRKLQARQRELILVGADALAALIRDGIAVGRRDDTEAPWLLLLELLQLLNREKEFEETAMDYCVTFEVSPPSFTAPHKVATAAARKVSASPDRFMLPPLLEGQLGPLLGQIQHYADQYQTLVFDCSRLARIDYACANQLHASLAQLDKKIEFRDVNHLVTALLRLLGFADIARIYPHNY